MKALQSFLRPEFLNRVDEIIHFNRLTEDNFRGITRIMLGELRDAMREKDIAFTWDDSLEEYLTKKSYSLTYGARNLRRHPAGAGGRHRPAPDRQLHGACQGHPCHSCAG